MKKLTFLFIATALTVCSLLSLCGCQTPVFSKSEANTHYELNVTIDSEQNKVSVNASVTVFNDGQELTQLPFAFYPAAYDGSAPPPVQDTSFDAAYPVGFNAGSYTFFQISGENVSSYEICKTPCLITIYLRSPLKNRQTTTVFFAYDLTLPYCNMPYGYNDFSVNLTRFYPVYCMSGGENNFYGYPPTGDPFVNDCADFDVTVHADTFAAVVSGAQKVSDNGDIVFNSVSARDFSLFLSKETNAKTYDKQGFEITVLSEDDDLAQKAADIAARALTTFSDIYCEPGQKSLTVVITPFLAAGNEYSGAAVINSGLGGSSFERTVVHEVAHQWWYSLVGNNQYKNAWLDEGLTEWSVVEYFRYNSMGSFADTLLLDAKKSYEDYCESMSSLGETDICDVSRTLSQYRDATDYTFTCYVKPMLALEFVCSFAGRDKTCAMLSEFAKKHAYGIASPEQFLQCLTDGYSKVFENALYSSFSPYSRGNFLQQ